MEGEENEECWNRRPFYKFGSKCLELKRIDYSESDFYVPLSFIWNISPMQHRTLTCGVLFETRIQYFVSRIPVDVRPSLPFSSLFSTATAAVSSIAPVLSTIMYYDYKSITTVPAYHTPVELILVYAWFTG